MANMMQGFDGIGRVGFIDELRNVGSKKEPLYVLHFTVAVKNSRELEDGMDPRDGETLYEAADGKVYAQSTMWVRCTVWNGYAQAMDRNLSVGDLVQVKGQLAYDLETGGPRTFVTKEGYPGAKFELDRVDVNILTRFESDDEDPTDEIDEIEEEEEVTRPKARPAKTKAVEPKVRQRPEKVATSNGSGPKSRRGPF